MPLLLSDYGDSNVRRVSGKRLAGHLFGTSARLGIAGTRNATAPKPPDSRTAYPATNTACLESFGSADPAFYFFHIFTFIIIGLVVNQKFETKKLFKLEQRRYRLQPVFFIKS